MAPRLSRESQLPRLVGELDGSERDRQTLVTIADLGFRQDDWQRVLEDMAVDPTTFLAKFGIDRAGLIENLHRSCRCFRRNDPAIFGYLGVLLLTALTLEQSERRRSLAPGRDAGSLQGSPAEQLARWLVDENDAVRDAIRLLYQPTETLRGDQAAWNAWSEVDFDHLKFHRFGSTSFILCGPEKRHHGGTLRSFALKCVLYAYSRIPSIAEATRQYSVRFAAEGRHRANAWASTDRWVLTDFVPGRTLAEWIQEEHRSNPREDRIRLDLMRKLGRPILIALAELERDELYHEDLSPTNIIIQREESHTEEGRTESYRAVLVDLGRNYLYTGVLGALEGPEALYVAPEIKDKSEPRDPNALRLADVYSLGHLLIALGGVGWPEDGTVPDPFYERVPPLARFIEDLIDRLPERRLLLFEPGSAGVFPPLAGYFEQELAVASKAEEQRADPSDAHWLRGGLDLLLPSSRSPRRYWEVWKERRKQRETNRSVPSMFEGRLLAWSLICAGCWYLVFIVLVLWTLRDLDFSVANVPIQALQRLLKSNGIPFIDGLRASTYKIPDLRGNLPARLAGFTFALAAAKYYQNIYAGLTPRLAPGLLSRLANLLMRSFAWWWAPMILAPNLIDPNWWAICTAVGLTGVWLANWAVSTFSNAAIERARANGLSTVPGREIAGLTMFSGWSFSSLIYASFTWPIALLITTGVLKDELVYMSGVAGVNLGIFYFEKCSRRAASVRGGLTRAFLAAERIHHVTAKESGTARPRGTDASPSDRTELRPTAFRRPRHRAEVRTRDA